MDLPSDIYAPILSFFPARDLLWFRLISKIHLDASKTYDQPIVSIVPLKCFPLSKHIPKHISKYYFYSNTYPEYFDACIKLRYLKVTTPIHPDSFKKMPHLQVLEIEERCMDDLVTTPMFYTLSSLTSLSIMGCSYLTDDIFLHLHQLEELSLLQCTQITSKGIRILKKLKVALLSGIPHITDEAFIDSGITDLQIEYNENITDKGILVMKQLKHLSLKQTPKIRGEFASLDLGHLKMNVPIGKTIDELKNDLKHIKYLYINDADY